MIYWEGEYSLKMSKRKGKKKDMFDENSIFPLQKKNIFYETIVYIIIITYFIVNFIIKVL